MFSLCPFFVDKNDYIARPAVADKPGVDRLLEIALNGWSVTTSCGEVQRNCSAQSRSVVHRRRQYDNLRVTVSSSAQRTLTDAWSRHLCIISIVSLRCAWSTCQWRHWASLADDNDYTTTLPLLLLLLLSAVCVLCASSSHADAIQRSDI